MALAEVVSSAVVAVGPERGRLQLAVEGAEGDHGNFIGTSAETLCQTHISNSAPAGSGGGWVAGDGGAAPGCVSAAEGRLAGAAGAVVGARAVGTDRLSDLLIRRPATGATASAVGAAVVEAAALIMTHIHVAVHIDGLGGGSVYSSRIRHMNQQCVDYWRRCPQTSVSNPNGNCAAQDVACQQQGHAAFPHACLTSCTAGHAVVT